MVIPKTNTIEEILFVDRLVALVEQRAGRAAGKGVVAFRGRMIDGPIADIERKVLARAQKAGGGL